MKTYGVFALALNLESLKASLVTLTLSDGMKMPVCTDGLVELVAQILGELKPACEEFGADSSLVSGISDLAEKLSRKPVDTNAPVLLAQLGAIVAGVHNNLEKRRFMVLSEEEADFYCNPDLFGESFKEKYPARAIKEVFDAGSCYAASLYTACIFHCMRVAEHGLRKLAANRTLRVKLKKRGRPCPIDYGTWQEVIDAIQAKIKRVRQRPVGPKREAELQFLSNAAQHCEYMKDIWRNEMAHARRIYKKEEALSAISRVKEFVTAVGEHRGSSPAEDSIMRLVEQAQGRAEAARRILGGQDKPALPTSA